MDGVFSFCVRFSGIIVRFTLPTPLDLPDCFAALRCADTDKPDVEYRVELLTTPLHPGTRPVYKRGDATIYPTKKGWLRIYSALTAADGCQVACLLRPDGHNILYYPASRWDYYRSDWHCTHLLAGEAMLLRHNAFLLHSSVVMVDGKAVLFSGPSGAGKSTQASLWAEFVGAQILNGDRCVIMKKQDGFYGGGSLWCGTSGIYRPEQAPIAGIILIKQGPENRLRRLGFEAFVPMFSQTTLNSWDPAFMETVSALYSELLEQVNVYELECRPCREAVELVYDTLFGKENA
jgi:hypothetical protein